MGVIIPISKIQVWELNRSIIHSTFTKCPLCARPCAGHWRYGCSDRSPSQMDLAKKSSRVLAFGLLDPGAPSTLSRLGLSLILSHDSTFPCFKSSSVGSFPHLRPISHLSSKPTYRKSISHSNVPAKASRLCLIGLSRSHDYFQTNHCAMKRNAISQTWVVYPFLDVERGTKETNKDHQNFKRKKNPNLSVFLVRQRNTHQPRNSMYSSLKVD